MKLDDFLYFTFSCFQSNLEDIKFILQDWASKDNKYVLSEKSYLFDLYLSSPAKGGAHPQKAYFFSYKEKVIMISNYIDGWETLAKYIATKLNVECISFKISDTDYSEAINSLRCISNGTIIRIVYSMKDPKWVFYQNGAPLDFENTSYYERRAIRDRLNKEILVSYSEKLGINMNSKYFWEAENSLFIEMICR